MNSEVRQVVLIDDNPDDRLLVKREARRLFPEADFLEITQPSEFESLLFQRPAHLVITDYQLRWSNGVEILKDVKNAWPDCPVVMFTGTGSEEIAVEAMKSGLDDYVLKSQKSFARLGPAMLNALEMARRGRDLRQASIQYAELFHSIPVALYRARPDGAFCDANQAMVELLRYPSRQALLETALPNLFLDPKQFEQWSQSLSEHGAARNSELQLRAHDGDLRWVRDNSRAALDPHNGLLVCEGSLEDITDQKAAEAEREQLILELQDALAKIKTLSGLLPICAACKKIRDDKGYWNQIETYIETHSDAEFTHSFCPECVRKLYPELTETAAKSRAL